MAHKHSIYDTDPHFKIDKKSREVINVSEIKSVIFQNDHNSERFTFEMPRRIDGHDMLLCDIVQIHYINVNSSTREQYADVYSVDDLQLSPLSDEVVICSWLVSANATRHVGDLFFVLVFKCTNEEDPSVVDYVWHTAIHKKMAVVATISNGESIATDYSDILAEWEAKLFDKDADPVDPEEVEKIIENYFSENPPSADPEQVKQIVESYLAENPPQADAPALDEEAVKRIVDAYLATNPPTVDSSEVEQIVSDYLSSNPPKDGDPGFSPSVALERTDDGVKITATNKDGTVESTVYDGRTPEKGVDYFTKEDIESIAQEASELVSIDKVLPEQVYFPNGASTTYAIGKVTLTNGMGELVPAGGTLKDFFNQFVDEKNPTKTDPEVSLTFSQAKAYEVGTKVTPTYSASLSAGSYTYGPDTGVKASAWSVTDTAGNTARTTASGSFPELTVTDGISYKITAEATHNAGAVPVTNTGNPYSAEQIAAGTKSATSGALTGYRNTFYGTLTAKSEPTSAIVRGLATKSGKALANGNSFNVTIPVGALRVMIAYPATLRDVNSIKDVNGMSAEIASGFTKKTVNVEGANGHTAISYKVYIMDFANANDKANTFTVKI